MNDWPARCFFKEPTFDGRFFFGIKAHDVSNLTQMNDLLKEAEGFVLWKRVATVVE